jgi:hypothetical protein
MVRRRQIARRAYELYLERGCREHRDQQDWFEAEREIWGKPGPVHMHRLWEVHEMIARRAYELYLDRSRQDGNAEEDWLRAEAEVYALPDLFSRAHAFYLSQGNGWGLMRRRAYVHYLPAMVRTAIHRTTGRKQRKMLPPVAGGTQGASLGILCSVVPTFLSRWRSFQWNLLAPDQRKLSRWHHPGARTLSPDTKTLGNVLVTR